MGCLNIEGGFFGESVQNYIFGVVGWGVTFFGELALQNFLFGLAGWDFENSKTQNSKY